MVHYNNLRLYKKSGESSAPKVKETGNVSTELSVMEDDESIIEYESCASFPDLNCQDPDASVSISQDEASHIDEAVVLPHTHAMKGVQDTETGSEDTQATAVDKNTCKQCVC